jgi:hypothetical protein
MRQPWKILVVLLVHYGLMGCATTRPLELPSKAIVQREQLVVHSDFKLPERHRLIEELTVLRNDMVRLLDAPVSDEPIYVYLFEDSDRYERYMAEHHPLLPTRRAFFIKSDTTLRVYAYWGERVAEDLRHEVTHAYLHAVFPYLPLWLDEGLAEYFETGRGTQGIHRGHIELLAEANAAGTWHPDLDRLESMTNIGEMDQLAYAESWLWIHFAVYEPTRAELLRRYLQSLKTDGEAIRMSLMLSETTPQLSSALLTHLQMLHEFDGNKSFGEDQQSP